MTSLRVPRPLPRVAACIVLSGSALWTDLAAAQGRPFTGFASLPSFARALPLEVEDSRWAGFSARASTGFEFSSSKRFGSYAGPTVGLEGRQMWQEGRLVYGVVGGFDYLAAIDSSGTPAFGSLAYSRGFSGALQMKIGTLLTPEVLLYAKAGASAVHEKWRFRPTSLSPPFTREDIAVRPDARVGVEWAVTDRLSVGVEAGVVGPGIR